jgi:hypothetical protein
VESKKGDFVKKTFVFGKERNIIGLELKTHPRLRGGSSRRGGFIYRKIIMAALDSPENAGLVQPHLTEIF